MSWHTFFYDGISWLVKFAGVFWTIGKEANAYGLQNLMKSYKQKQKTPSKLSAEIRRGF